MIGLPDRHERPCTEASSLVFPLATWRSYTLIIVTVSEDVRFASVAVRVSFTTCSSSSSSPGVVARADVDTSNTHRPLSSSFLGLPYGILNMNHKKELLRGL